MTQSLDKASRQIKDVIDTKKIDKYIERHQQGEIDNLVNSLPNMLSTGNFNREKYDYRLGQFKAKSHGAYNSNVILVLQRFERAKLSKLAFERQRELDKLEILKALNQLRDAVNGFYEANGKSPYL